MPVPDLTADDLRALFDAPAPMTVGVEEELMLLDPRTLDLVPRAAEALAALDGDPRFTKELPAAQLEIVLPPSRTAHEATERLRDAREHLRTALNGELALATAGVHPFAHPIGELNHSERYDRIRDQYGEIPSAQLVFALQVHVKVSGADRALAVHNAIRGELPLIAALAASAPLLAGRDTGLASVRPQIGGLLPRQGVPPVIESWETHAATLARLGDPMQWWWEIRPHPRHGTLEVRVPDAQPDAADAGAVIGTVHALVADLAHRHDEGEQLPAPPRDEVEELRWPASRHGATGPLRERVRALLDRLEPAAERVGATAELERARHLAEHPTHARMREAAERGGPRAAAAELAGAYSRD